MIKRIYPSYLTRWQKPGEGDNSARTEEKRNSQPTPFFPSYIKPSLAERVVSLSPSVSSKDSKPLPKIERTGVKRIDTETLFSVEKVLAQETFMREEQEIKEADRNLDFEFYNVQKEEIAFPSNSDWQSFQNKRKMSFWARGEEQATSLLNRAARISSCFNMKAKEKFEVLLDEILYNRLLLKRDVQRFLEVVDDLDNHFAQQKLSFRSDEFLSDKKKEFSVLVKRLFQNDQNHLFEDCFHKAVHVLYENRGNSHCLDILKPFANLLFTKTLVGKFLAKKEEKFSGKFYADRESVVRNIVGFLKYFYRRKGFSRIDKFIGEIDSDFKKQEVSFLAEGKDLDFNFRSKPERKDFSVLQTELKKNLGDDFSPREKNIILYNLSKIINFKCCPYYLIMLKNEINLPARNNDFLFKGERSSFEEVNLEKDNNLSILINFLNKDEGDFPLGFKKLNSSGSLGLKISYDDLLKGRFERLILEKDPLISVEISWV